MTAAEIATRHQRSRRRISQSAEAQGVQLWRQVDADNVRASWTALAPQAARVLAAAQFAAASQSNDYVGAIASELNVDTEADGRVVPFALSGLSADGRPLVPLLNVPAGYALRALRQGSTSHRALASGQAALRMILRTEVADAGRVADGIATTARPTMGYVRQVSPPSCPRCAILAGRWYRYSQRFQRHPGCDCTMVPAPESMAGELETSPQRLFDEGQIRGLSAADRRAIREGADMNRVVNAHRGMYTASGNRKLTKELSPAGRQRLRPESIYREAASREDAVRLLRLHGYLD